MIGKTISHYKILEKLGEGGMGVVYKAEDTKLKRTVALKFFTPQMLGTEEDKTRFILEAQAAAALDHPNICTIYEIDEAEGQTFIAMAYVDGQSIEEKLESGPLEIKETLDITIQVAEGLKEAHKKGIIHRDIKSANIMVTENGQVKIMDFGLAKLAGRSRLTKTATIMGTVAYMSPEQASGEATIDHRTDIWSLGVVLYKMLTGKPPFDAPSDAALIHKIIYEAPKPISSLRSDIPLALKDAIQKMLQKNPEHRYDDTATLISDLQSIRSRTVSVTTKSTPSIAVLPFVNMSADPEQEYFCDGLAEELINALTQIENLHVVARTSAFSFKGEKLDVREIGGKLNVETVLEGSVRKAGSRLRITSQLVKVSDGYHLWSERFDRDMEDIFAVQDEITLAIVDKLKPKLLVGEKTRLARQQTVDIEAYNLYLKGIWFWNKRTKEDIAKAIECFEQAIARDSEYAAAYAGLASAFSVLPTWTSVPPNEAYPKAKQMALKALEIDSNLSEAHSSLGVVKMIYDWDWEGSEREYKRAIDLNPGFTGVHQVYAILLNILGRSDEATKEARKALELDPLSLPTNLYAAVVFLGAGRFDEAIELLSRVIEMDPVFPLAHFQRGNVYLEKSMYEEALDEYKQERHVRGWWDFCEAMIGCTYAKMGRREEAEKIMDDLIKRSNESYISPFVLAILSFELGEADKGFAWLDEAYEQRDQWLSFLKADPTLDSVRSDPRYTALRKKMGLDK